MSDTVGNQGFPGQKDFSSANSQSAVMEFVFRTLAGEFATVTLVKVTAVHPGANKTPGTVDVQLLVNQQDSLGNITPHGVLYGLPYSRVQANKAAVIIDPAVGDIGVAVFASRDISSVKANLKQSNPGSFRQFDYSDGIYLFTSLSAVTPTDYIEILPDGGINIKDRFGNIISMSETNTTIQDGNGNSIVISHDDGVTITDRFDNVIALTTDGISMTDGNGNSIVADSSGTTINGILFPIGGTSFNIKTHTHHQGVDSHGDTEQPALAPDNGS